MACSCPSRAVLTSACSRSTRPLSSSPIPLRSNANIIFGAVVDDTLGDEVRVTVIAAGLNESRNDQGVGGGSASGADSGGSSFSSNGSGGAEFGGPAAGSGSAGVGAAKISAGGFAGTGPETDAAPASRPRHGASDPGSAEPSRDGFSGRQAAAHVSNGASGAYAPDTGFAVVSGAAPGAILGAPVPDDGLTAPADWPVEATPAPPPASPPAPVSTGAHEMPRQEPARTERPERVAVASDAARTFDVPTTRRRPVVFEEDDDLDVPDFLK